MHARTTRCMIASSLLEPRCCGASLAVRTIRCPLPSLLSLSVCLSRPSDIEIPSLIFLHSFLSNTTKPLKSQANVSQSDKRMRVVCLYAFVVGVKEEEI